MAGSTKRTEIIRYFMAVIVFAIFAALTLVMMIALLSDWPEILHGSGDRSAIHNHDLTIHEAIAVADHEGSILGELFRAA